MYLVSPHCPCQKPQNKALESCRRRLMSSSPFSFHRTSQTAERTLHDSTLRPIGRAIGQASSGRLVEGRGNPGDRRFRVAVDIHTLMADELLISDNWHTNGHGSDRAPNQADKPLRRKRGAICEKVG
jgi:hypothetical protein